MHHPYKTTRGARREAHISAEPPCPQAPPRVSCPHVHQERPQDYQPPPREGPQAAFGLSERPPETESEALVFQASEIERPRPRMIPMKRRQDFLAASRGRHAVQRGVVVQARRREPGPDSPVRVGFTASRRVGGAVVRNRAKRRLRSAAALTLPRVGQAGWDYVLIARPGSTAVQPFAQLLNNIVNAVQSIHSGASRRRRAPRR